jgi:hypothetical protein
VTAPRCAVCRGPGARLLNPGDGRGSRHLCADCELARRLAARELRQGERVGTEGIVKVTSRKWRR